MKRGLLLSKTVALALTSMLFIACGGGGGGGSSESPAAVSGVLVDPYIEGAILCEDLAPHNGICDPGEQTSSQTDENGKFTFANELTPGSHIIVNTAGYHNDVPYTLDLSGIVSDDGTIEVVSPLTALQTRGLTTAQIVTLLSNAGLTGLSEEDILANPLEGDITSLTSLSSDAQLKRLHATLATYGMLKILEGSNTLKALSANELLNSTEVDDILTLMVTNIQNALSKSLLDDINNGVSAYANPQFTPPAVSVGVIASSAVSIIDALTKIGYEACNQTDGTDTQKAQAALDAVNASAASILAESNALGMRFYFKENLNAYTPIYDYLPSNIQAQVDTAQSDEAIVLNTSGESVAIASQSTNVSNMQIHALADATTQAQPTLFDTCQEAEASLGANPDDDPNMAAGLDCDGDGYPVSFATPRGFKVALKTFALIDSSDQPYYLIKKDTLAESVVFDITDSKTLGDLTIPKGTYTKVYAEIYYYWLDLQTYEADHYTQFRVYMSDDNTAHATEGNHQGDIVLTDANNSVEGWLAAGGVWKVANIVPVRPEPMDPDVPLYASTKDPETSRQRGPFGGTEFWNNIDNNRYDATANEDIFYSEQDISLNVTQESGIELRFAIKDNWYWEDFDGNGIFGPVLDTDPVRGSLEASDVNGSWAPLLNMPEITVIQ